MLNRDVPCKYCYSSVCPQVHNECLTLVPPAEVAASAIDLLQVAPWLTGSESKMYTLGLNAAFHDPAACLVRDGVVIAAAEDERFTHVKHGKRPLPFTTWELPFHAIDYCLRQAEIELQDVDHVAYSFDPWLLTGRATLPTTLSIPLEPGSHPAQEGFDSSWEPLFLASITNAPGFLLDAVPLHLKRRFRGVALGQEPYRWHWVPHHLSHAASAFHCSPFPRAAILTLDGRGERATTGYAVGIGHQIEWLGQVCMPHSLGMLYEEVTDYLGFLRSSDEYKVMALASYGEPRFVADFREIVRLGPDGQYQIEAPRLSERFGPAREKGDPIARCTTTSLTRFRLSSKTQFSKSADGCIAQAAVRICAWPEASLSTAS